ncbi:MAG: TMEM165/GDT1 family protein [Steroidobacterales bacterium]
MDWKTAGIVFGTVFLAELGDKTQLATLLFSANRPDRRWVVFLAAASALVVACAIGVLAGSGLGRFINPRHLTLIAGAGFIAIGLWTVWTAVR